MAIRVVNPGEPSTTYHWETEQEDFLVLAGEALLIVEGQEQTKLARGYAGRHRRIRPVPPSQPTRYRDGLLPG